MKIHHFGFAVENIEKAINDFKEIFGFEKEKEIVKDKIQGVRIAFLRDFDKKVKIELLEPLDKSSPVYGKKGLLHICFQAKNFEETYKLLRERGFLPVKNPEKAEAIKGGKVSFFYSKEYGLIEIVEIIDES